MPFRKFAYPTNHHRYQSSTNSVDRTPSSHSAPPPPYQGSRSIALRSRGASVRSDTSFQNGKHGDGSGSLMDDQSGGMLQSQIRQLARTCDVDFLERIVPSHGPKDSAEKEAELIRRLMRNTTKAGKSSHSGAGSVSRKGSKASHIGSAASNGERKGSIGGASTVRGNEDGDDPRSTLVSALSTSIASRGAAHEKAQHSIESSLRGLLRQLRRCETSKALTPSFREKLFSRRGLKYQGPKDFVAAVKRGIDLIESMLMEAPGLGHDDLAASLAHINDSFEREVSWFLNRGSKSSEIAWDMLQLQTTRIVDEAVAQWERAAEARSAFQSFALLCLTRHMQKQQQHHQRTQSDAGGSRMSDRNRVGGGNEGDGTRSSYSNDAGGAGGSDDENDEYDDEDVDGGRHELEGGVAGGHSNAGNIKRSLTDASDRSTWSFYHDLTRSASTQEKGGGGGAMPRNARQGSSGSLSSASGMGRRRASGGGKDHRSMSGEPLMINVAQFGGDHAATSDLISRIRALQSPVLTHIQEEDDDQVERW